MRASVYTLYTAVVNEIEVVIHTIIIQCCNLHSSEESVSYETVLEVLALELEPKGVDT